MNKLTLATHTLWMLFFSTLTLAEDGGCKTLTFKELNALPHKVESYPFRVWYATEGEHALKYLKANSDSNNTPMIVNDLLLQLHSADKYYNQRLGLTPPLSQPRYKLAEFINVYLLAMDKGNGLTFDEVVAEKAARRAKRYSCGVKIHINSDLQPSRNVTPAHELFHLYQYSNSMFKMRWYLEGMTRWVEQAFRGSSPKELKKVVPTNCVDIFSESYTASRYWQGLARRQQADDIIISSSERKLRYSDGQAVFQADTFKNGSAIQTIF